MIYSVEEYLAKEYLPLLNCIKGIFKAMALYQVLRLFVLQFVKRDLHLHSRF